jgi:hypothetical protein
MEAGDFRLRGDALATLRQRELLRIADGLRGELGKTFFETGIDERVLGRFTRGIDTPGGRYALIEKSCEYTLVPWRDVLERQIGKPVAGIMRSDGISWRIGRGRAGSTIS